MVGSFPLRDLFPPVWTAGTAAAGVDMAGGGGPKEVDGMGGCDADVANARVADGGAVLGCKLANAETAEYRAVAGGVVTVMLAPSWVAIRSWGRTGVCSLSGFIPCKVMAWCSPPARNSSVGDVLSVPIM